MPGSRILFAFNALLLAFSGAAHAQETKGPHISPWQMNFQPPASPVMERLYDTHTFLLWLITSICVFVLALLVYICLRFRRKANPVPSKTTHNAKLEVIWTTIPILILVAIAIPSLRLHFYMTKTPDPELTIKAVGYQWYWHYQYPDNGNFEFDSYMVKQAELKEGQPRLLTVDNKLVVPVDTTVRVLLTGADVIHAFAMPAFGVKRDAIPGRLNETWFKAKKTGTYYGQCSELCGVGHGFMPIELEVVSKEDFATWTASKRQAAGIKEPVKTQQASATQEKKTESKQTATE
ncbi:MAG: cytochrome c oxidase subunit II [Proteobacteria bacterium]|nr:cytochrome c oxidase subunit II [Pseudomonadota bacterium]